jgi:hypothetical protein
MQKWKVAQQYLQDGNASSSKTASSKRSTLFQRPGATTRPQKGNQT